MPALYEADQVGKREALADLIAVTEVEENPFTSMLNKRKKSGNMVHSWQAKKHKVIGHTGIVDGKDADEFNSNNRELIEGVAQKIWDTPGVSDLAEESDVAGIKSEMQEQIADSIVAVKGIVEKRALSNADCQLGNKVIPYETRGAFQWLLATAQGVKPVPEAFRTSSACIYSSAIASLTETAFKAMCAQSFKDRKGKTKLDGFLGIEAKTQISTYSQYSDDVSSKTAIRAFNMDAKDRALISVVDKLVMDTGEIDLHLTAKLWTDPTTGEDTAYTHKSGIFCDMKFFGLMYRRLPRVHKLPYLGGGHKAIVDAIISFMCDNPVGHMALKCSS